ncbi:Protein kinase domain [Ranunculus cassubicifolius]
MQKLIETIWPFSYQRLPDNKSSLEDPLLLSSTSGLDAQTSEKLSPNLKIFSTNELEKATSKFCSSNMYGKDDNGEMYKGWINERTMAATKPGKGIVVAIKKFYNYTPHTIDEWLKEIKLLGQLDHPNIVKTIGYCLENNQFIIVSEFMPGGSLEDYLFKGKFLITWTFGMKIALGAAKGLAFLLNSEPSVLHWNYVTSFNILLDSNYNAKISDFRYEKVHNVDPRINGYATPQMLMQGRYTMKSHEVYSFGVVLFEILFGRRAFDFDITEPSRNPRLVDWVCAQICRYKPKPTGKCDRDWASDVLDKSELLGVIDSHYKGKYPHLGAVRLFMIALACTNDLPNARANIDEVVEALQWLQEKKERTEQNQFSSFQL